MNINKRPLRSNILMCKLISQTLLPMNVSFGYWKIFETLHFKQLISDIYYGEEVTVHN